MKKYQARGQPFAEVNNAQNPISHQVQYKKFQTLTLVVGLDLMKTYLNKAKTPLQASPYPTCIN